MNLEEERKAFFYELDGHGYTFTNMKWLGGCFEDDMLNMAWEMWSSGKAAKAQVPNTQALHDRLLVESIRGHVESHIAEVTVADLFDKGWLAAMKCIQNNIDMLEAQEQSND